jgi:hypothetical protein
MAIEYVDILLDGVNLREEYGIYRVAENDGYNEKGLPDLDAKTTEISGGDGQYWFKTNYRTKVFDFKIAYDSLYRYKLSEFVTKFVVGSYHSLVLAEQPYKQYNVRVSDTPEFNYVPFDDDVSGTKQTIYKGTGTIQFIADDPFAYSISKKINDFKNDQFYDDWIVGSGLKDLTGYDTYSNGVIKLYNGGQLPTDYILHCSGASGTVIINLYDTDLSTILTTYSIENAPSEFYINSKTHLIGNKYFTTLYGNFYKEIPTIVPIPVGESKITFNGITSADIDYKYKYF